MGPITVKIIYCSTYGKSNFLKLKFVKSILKCDFQQSNRFLKIKSGF